MDKDPAPACVNGTASSWLHPVRILGGHIWALMHLNYTVAETLQIGTDRSMRFRFFFH